MTVEERLEALEKEVQRLKDVQAIKELKSKYFRALDTKNWDELETTMTPNISTAYSNGSSFDTLLAKPLTIIDRASSSLIPRDIR